MVSKHFYKSVNNITEIDGVPARLLLFTPAAVKKERLFLLCGAVEPPACCGDDNPVTASQRIMRLGSEVFLENGVTM